MSGIYSHASIALLDSAVHTATVRVEFYIVYLNLMLERWLVHWWLVGLLVVQGRSRRLLSWELGACPTSRPSSFSVSLLVSPLPLVALPPVAQPTGFTAGRSAPLYFFVALGF